MQKNKNTAVTNECKSTKHAELKHITVVGFAKKTGSVAVNKQSKNKKNKEV